MLSQSIVVNVESETDWWLLSVNWDFLLSINLIVTTFFTVAQVFFFHLHMYFLCQSLTSYWFYILCFEIVAWCGDTKSRINSRKVNVLWPSLNNKSLKASTPDHHWQWANQARGNTEMHRYSLWQKHVIQRLLMGLYPGRGKPCMLSEYWQVHAVKSLSRMYVQLLLPIIEYGLGVLTL